ncbi:hypothetical protein AMTR_s00001p00256830 [Amborella trichopoda]|uniref:J domain-containing protein n=1 Tax=Amborella trichopoda TaxID=13333 RepID=W1NLR9_AMBTC|nr:hypothetical protein AMTR_s00001p00256830 [Amborella trichopoda]
MLLGNVGSFKKLTGKAMLERHQRTMERVAKALAENNEQDVQLQRDQAERHRIAETLDSAIRQWTYGKEGNLRALLSSLQYVLWPECGWQPVPLTDLITAVSVKKVYVKATLFVHPDKMMLACSWKVYSPGLAVLLVIHICDGLGMHCTLSSNVWEE